jgi:hypothetical protein
MTYQIKINRGTKLPPKRVHLVNVYDGHAIIKPILAGGDPFESAKVFGCGNPKTTGSTAGERILLSRRNTSKFTVAGTAH